MATEKKINQRTETGRFQSIDRIYAFIITEKDGEGIMGLRMPNGEWMPFIGADLPRVQSLKEMADRLGVKYEIRYFERYPPV